jgi:hypothetical protein
VREGGRGAPDPASAAANVDIVICVVVNAAQVEAVLFGENGVASSMPEGAARCCRKNPSSTRGDTIASPSVRKRLASLGRESPCSPRDRRIVAHPRQSPKLHAKHRILFRQLASPAPPY